jgi:hypothetical protein
MEGRASKGFRSHSRLYQDQRHKPCFSDHGSPKLAARALLRYIWVLGPGPEELTSRWNFQWVTAASRSVQLVHRNSKFLPNVSLGNNKLVTGTCQLEWSPQDSSLTGAVMKPRTSSRGEILLYDDVEKPRHKPWPDPHKPCNLRTNHVFQILTKRCWALKLEISRRSLRLGRIRLH